LRRPYHRSRRPQDRALPSLASPKLRPPAADRFGPKNPSSRPPAGSS
jgi:hypothetical protein